MKRAALIVSVLVPAVAAGCGSFDDPAIVVDLRILGMAAEPPEQLFAFDPEAPPDPSTIELAPVEVCAHVGDPADARGLEWRMRACPNGDGLRCDENKPMIVMATGSIEDPETAATPQEPCAILPGGSAPVPLLVRAIEDDTLGGFGGIDLLVELRVAPPGGGEDVAVYGSKRVRYAAHVPAERTPNRNPTVERFDVAVNEGALAPLPLGRCREQTAPLTITVGDEVEITPVEPREAREMYVVPTFDGGFRSFTESLTYQWLAGAGEYSRGGTGGPRDAFGNFPPLDTTFRTPAAEEVTAPIDVPIWINQRDERLGSAWFHSCIRVLPAGS